jgi:hypothetical protein
MPIAAHEQHPSSVKEKRVACVLHLLQTFQVQRCRVLISDDGCLELNPASAGDRKRASRYHPAQQGADP